MRRRLLTAGVLFLLLTPPTARAWGIAGHVITADIAERHLSPAALQQVQALLATEGLQHLDQVATWADEIRSTRKEAAPWHYVDIPLAASSYVPERDCAKGDCVIAAIARFSQTLADPSQPPAARLEALKFLVHFVGDVHQPLHAAENAGDHGGNKVWVSYLDPGLPSVNLHWLWDSVMLEHRLGVSEGPPGQPNPAIRPAASRLAPEIDAELAPPPAAASDLDPVHWAMESHDLAAQVVYPGVVATGALPSAQPVLVDAVYDQRAWPVVRQRLGLAGLRLAGLLNRLLPA
jgi:hypothetical protein